jgi:hypothetical protein
VSTITEIQEAIAQLNAAEREELRRWLAQFDEDDWDRQISADAASGKLNFMEDEARRAQRDGKLRPLPGEVQDDT